jgi:predicted DNA-binding transcriptional regulator AlpA
MSYPFIVRRNQLKEVTGISASSCDRLEAAGKFPKKRRWSQGITGHLGSELQKWAEDQGKVI